MLLRALFLLLLVATLSETAVHGAGALARVALQHAELAAMRTASSAAVAAAASAAPSGTVPTPFATCYLAHDTACEISVTSTLTTGTPSAIATPSACPGTPCTIFLQSNTAVAEGRAVYHIVTTVTANNGDVVLSRQGDIAFRTFATPPYTALVGSLDATLDALGNGGVGDDGGNASAAGTLISIEYVPSGASGSPIPGNVWRSQDQQPVTAVPSWDR